MAVRDFYSRILRIDDARLRQLDWSAVLDRLIRVPRLVRTHQSVTALDITNRIMRVDNYVIAMVNKVSSNDRSIDRSSCTYLLSHRVYYLFLNGLSNGLVDLNCLLPMRSRLRFVR
jgi:hypothetical protein